MSSSQLTFIFLRGVAQPPTRYQRDNVCMELPLEVGMPSLHGSDPQPGRPTTQTKDASAIFRNARISHWSYHSCLLCYILEPDPVFISWSQFISLFSFLEIPIRASKSMIFLVQSLFFDGQAQGSPNLLALDGKGVWLPVVGICGIWIPWVNTIGYARWNLAGHAKSLIYCTSNYWNC